MFNLIRISWSQDSLVIQPIAIYSSDSQVSLDRMDRLDRLGNVFLGELSFLGNVFLGELSFVGTGHAGHCNNYVTSLQTEHSDNSVDI